jgi:two-component system, NtrC family, nitrogen regulation response regulator NtrX
MENKIKILIVDDDPTIRESLQEILSYEGYECSNASDGKRALEKLKNEKIDLMLLDLKLPRINGMEVLKESIKIKPELPVIMISGQGTIQLAVEATKLGAYDFLEKPLEAERTLLTIKNALEKSFLKYERDRLLSENKQNYQMIGNDPKMKEIFTQIDKAAKVNSKVLIMGESGTGKERVARAIHFNSERSSCPFVPVNCSAIPETLIESELFGHKMGSFTGAIDDRKGKFEQANKGTLLLDEIGDMSLMTQAKILRALEENKIEPVGNKKPIIVDVRIIAATNKNLKEEIKKGNFREDLFYRLNVISVHLPPLRERKTDIRPLVESFLEDLCSAKGIPQKTFAQNVWSILLENEWPGNIRELFNLIESITVLTSDLVIDSHTVQDALENKNSQYIIKNNQQTLRKARSKFEKSYIKNTLINQGGKIQATADVLGIQRSHLWKKMKQYKIDKIEN